MRWNNDENLAKNCPEIDLIIAGHDHDYAVKKGFFLSSLLIYNKHY